MTLYTRLDAVLIKQLLVDGDVQNGIYASSYRLLDACNMMVAMVSMLLLPMFSKMIADKQHPESLVELASAVMIVPATVIAFGAFFYKEALMKSMFPASSDQAYEVFGWIILSFIPMSMMYIYGTLLTANANLKTLIKYASIGLVINILLNLILIPPYKALGAAIATLSTQAFIGFSNFIAAKKELNLQFSTYFSKRFFVSIAFIFVCCLMTSIYVKSWFWGFLVIGTLSMAVTFSSKLLSLRSIGALLPLQADKIKDNQ
jgi:O-antigen/teichoic acid export membrane protein